MKAEGRRQSRFYCLGFLFACILPFVLRAQITLDGKTYGPKPVVSGLTVPWGMEWMGSDSIMFSQIDGRVFVANVATGGIKEVLRLNVARENQAGLQDIKLDQDFVNNKRVFLSYCYYQQNNLKMRVSAFSYSNQSLTNEQIILNDISIVNANIGGRLALLNDKLFLSIGDQREASSAQQTNNKNGKILRLNKDGSIPADNPFPGSFVWSYGHRNPQGLCVVDSTLYSSEHGPSNNDEINIITKAANYGWPRLSGKCPSDLMDTCVNRGFIDPIHVWDPPVAPSGLDYYPEQAGIAEWANSLLVSSLRGQSLYQLKLSSNGISFEKEYLNGLIGRIREVLVSPEGRVFISSSNEDVFGTPREGGDKIFELVEGYVYEPPNEPIDTTLSEVIRLEQSVLQTRVIAKNLEIPWDLDMDHQGLLWFSERNGQISTLNTESGEIRKVYKIAEVYQSEDNSGLHAMALHPRFPIVPYVFVNYTFELFGARLVRYTYSLNSKTFVDSSHLIAYIPANITHNGSRIVFENDSIMYVALGDGFTGREPQLTSSNVGKILRMSIDGKVPEDNPFPGSFTWSLGHRNPQGLCFGKNGNLYSSEHGVATDDELNLIEKGRNYGWPRVEGFCDFISEAFFCDSANVREPLLTWTPTEAPCGLAYFEHPSIPEWQGNLLQSFLKNKELTLIQLNDEGNEVLGQIDYLDRLNAEGKKVGVYGRLRDVFVAPNGKIYLATSNREDNGKSVVKDDDDKIIEIYNPEYTYESNERELVEAASELFPNPAEAYFVLKPLKGEELQELMIIDSMGNIVRHRKLRRDEQEEFIQIDRKGLSPGLYIVHLKYAFSHEEFKLVFL